MRPRSFRPRASRICTTHHRKRPRHPSGEACHLSTRITERSRPAAKTTASGPIPRVQPARDTASSRGGGSCNAPVFNGTVFAAPDNRPTAIADRPTRTKEDRRKKNLRPYRPAKLPDRPQRPGNSPCRPHKKHGSAMHCRVSSRDMADRFSRRPRHTFFHAAQRRDNRHTAVRTHAPRACGIPAENAPSVYAPPSEGKVVRIVEVHLRSGRRLHR